MATGAAAEVKKTFIDQSLSAFTKNIEDDLKEGKYDVVKSGITIANDIMNEFITTSISATVQGQRPASNPADLFTMMQTMAKTNAALLAIIGRSEYQEKLMRTMGSKYGSDIEAVKAQVTEVVDKVQVQTSTDDVMKKMAEMLNTGGVKGDGGGKPVSEHKAIQQLRNFAGDRSKFREWNEKLLNALGQVHIGNRKKRSSS